jgi:hypothetical protein
MIPASATTTTTVSPNVAARLSMKRIPVRARIAGSSLG